MALKKKLSLGESLVQEGMLTPEQLLRAQAEDKKTGQRLRKILVRLGFIAEEDLVSFLSDRLGLPRIELGNILIDPKIAELIPEDLARKHEVIPILKIGNRLTCAMVDPWNVFALDELRAKTGLIIEPAVATESEIKKSLEEYYGAKGGIEDVIKSIQEEQVSLREEKELDLKRLDEISKEPVVVKLVHLLLMEAIRRGASDIHVEPEEHVLKVRFRMDGMLREIAAPPKHLQPAIISRIKIMANLDIAERRTPQDGRFNLRIEGREIDVRVSCVPTIYGENVVLRLLDVSQALLSLGQLGFSRENFEKYAKLIHRPHGIVLVTGPTGSGKTTTLYSSLAKINTPDKNIITIEDPVEYRLPGIRQTQVNSKVNLTFANGLRSILRQDPDVIMVGEIRDFETAEIAIQAALTGHLVFSTLHTNDAPGAVTRLIDMGVEPFLVSSAVVAFAAQRLVRTICPQCREKYQPSPEDLREIGPADGAPAVKIPEGPSAFRGGGGDFYRGRGCQECLDTGYKGRLAIFELLVPDEKIRHLTVMKASSEEIRKQARVSGMMSLREDGLLKAREGITTIEEVLRVTQDE
ncbi:MAG: type II secretion system ATPase GspE [Candidatus Omnitrophica bacterium]|nr:type II secretion system ATPase GspE [Candidatus Omnitrophota bacterium]